jgi:pimeloyl-ACP methyl ester carboxylesterase
MGNSVSLDGVTIAYDDAAAAHGTGSALVMVHGHPFNRSMWRPQVEHLGRSGRRVVAPDLRGYGESTVVAGMTTLDVFARDIANLLDHLGEPSAVLVGLSMGGQIVMDFYRQFPDRVRAVVLAATFADPETAAGRERRNRIADRLLREGMADYAVEELPKMVAPATIAARPAVAEHVLAMMRSTPAEGAAAALRGRAERPDYLPVLAKLAVPALVVVGEEDTYTPVPVARSMHEVLPDSTLVIIEGAAHLPNLERPAEFGAALDRFLGGLSR